MNYQQPFSTAEVAALFAVSEDTVRGWGRDRLLVILPDGRVPARALDVFLRTRAESVVDMTAVREMHAAEAREICSVFGIDPVGAEMRHITGMSEPALRRLGTEDSKVEPRRWLHIAVVAAIAREMTVLTEGATGQRVDPGASRRWLFDGRIPTAQGDVAPIDALAGEAMALQVLAELRRANA